MKFPWANTLLLAFIAVELASGLGGLMSGSPGAAVFIQVHRVAGYGILVLLIWKGANVAFSLRWRRRVAPRTASLMLAAALLFGAYVLDNCDGEIAVLKDQCTEFGRLFDSFVDEVVHVAFFIGLGIGTMRATDEVLWLWLGVIAAVGATINYIIGLVKDLRTSVSSREEAHALHAPDTAVRPEGWAQWMIFIFRENFRSDFCFIVLALALVGHTWLLLPAAAVGAQVYWVTHFYKVSRKFHV